MRVGPVDPAVGAVRPVGEQRVREDDLAAVTLHGPLVGIRPRDRQRTASRVGGTHGVDVLRELVQRVAARRAATHAELKRPAGQVADAHGDLGLVMRAVRERDLVADRCFGTAWFLRAGRQRREAHDRQRAAYLKLHARHRPHGTSGDRRRRASWQRTPSLQSAAMFGHSPWGRTSSRHSQRRTQERLAETVAPWLVVLGEAYGGAIESCLARDPRRLRSLRVLALQLWSHFSGLAWARAQPAPRRMMPQGPVFDGLRWSQ